MKKILCFGDSNTFGFIPGVGARYDKNTRWTGVLQGILGENYKIIEAGCNNRTCFSNNPSGELYTGIKAILRHTKDSADFLVLAIGTNDLQSVYNTSLDNFKNGLFDFLTLVKNNYSNSKIILVAPSVIKDDVLKSGFSVMFDKNSIEKSKDLPEIYKATAKEFDIIFLDGNSTDKVSKTDGLHFTKEGHNTLAQELAAIIKGNNVQ